MIGDAETLVLGILNLPALHCFSGIVDKLMNNFKSTIFSTKVEEGQAWMDRYLKKEGIVRKMKQGRPALEGNQCNAFLQKTDKLEQDLLREGGDITIKGLPFVVALRAFKKLQEGCLGMELADDWLSRVETFSKEYKSLDNVTVTPKVHILIHHLEDFFNQKGKNKGLSYWTEQAFEAVHHDFKDIWARYKVNSDHPDYGKQLKSAIVAYNYSHI